MNKQSKPYANPYLAGFFLGLLLLFTYFISGHGLGSSGAVKQFTITAINKIAPDIVSDNEYFNYSGPSFFRSWIVLIFIGSLLGGFISGAVSGRLRFIVEKGPKAKIITRLIMAVIGGILFGFGAQLGRGCTSGAALSGMAVLSASGIITMMAIFGTGFAIAWIFKRFWV